MKATAVLLILALSLWMCAGQTCYPTITTKARTDQYSTWFIGATRYQIYDITITNGGTCALSQLIALFSAVGAGGFISEGWNYDITTGLFSGFGNELAVGQSFLGAGFVLANSSQPMLMRTQPTCAGSCSPSTAAPTSTPSTSAPSTKAPTTAAPTTAAPTTAAPTTAAPTTVAPTTIAPTTTAAPKCAVLATATRDGDIWVDSQGRNNAVYRVSIKNNGPCTLTQVIVSFDYNYAVSALVNYWNMHSVRNGLVNQEGLIVESPILAAGASYNGAGIILAGNTPDVLGIFFNPSCQC